MRRFAGRYGGVTLAAVWVVGWAAIFAAHFAVPAPATARLAQGFAMPVAALFVPAFLCSNTRRQGGH